MQQITNKYLLQKAPKIQKNQYTLFKKLQLKWLMIKLWLWIKPTTDFAIQSHSGFEDFVKFNTKHTI